MCTYGKVTTFLFSRPPSPDDLTKLNDLVVEINKTLIHIYLVFKG